MPRLAARPGITALSDIKTTDIPFISIIVPVRNEANHIAHTLASLLGQDYPADRFEILVADGRSTDDTPTIVTRPDRSRQKSPPARQSENVVERRPQRRRQSRKR